MHGLAMKDREGFSCDEKHSPVLTDREGDMDRDHVGVSPITSPRLVASPNRSPSPYNGLVAEPEGWPSSQVGPLSCCTPNRSPSPCNGLVNEVEGWGSSQISPLSLHSAIMSPSPLEGHVAAPEGRPSSRSAPFSVPVS